MSADRFAKCWERYSEKVLPRGAGEVQVTETRRAFYAGGTALFYAVMAMLEPGSEPTEADMRAMTALRDELDAFAAALVAGRA